MMTKTISKERLEKEFARTEQAFKVVRVIVKTKESEELFDSAKRYYNDAKYFRDKGDFASAFGALNYAFGLLDGGAKLKFFDVSANKEIFTAD
jgi:hypothetical protein